jgi:hypothetical protein
MLFVGFVRRGRFLWCGVSFVARAKTAAWPASHGSVPCRKWELEPLLLVSVDEVAVLILVVVVLIEVLGGLGEVDVATARAPAHDVLLVDLLHVVLIGLLDLLCAGFL